MGAGPLVSRVARVSVRAEPGLPYITQVSHVSSVACIISPTYPHTQATDSHVMEAVEGSTIALDCVSPGARQEGIFCLRIGRKIGVFC